MASTDSTGGAPTPPPAAAAPAAPAPDKLVHVPGQGLMSFPGAMPDEHVATAIQQHMATRGSVPSQGEPSPYSLNNAPQFLRDALPMDKVRIDSTPVDIQKVYGNQAIGSENTQAFVSPTDPYTIHVQRPDVMTQNVLDHELSHVYMDSLEQNGVKFAPVNAAAPYDYGGVSGLEAAAKAGKPVTSFSQEQLARLVQDNVGRTMLMQAMAHQSAVSPSDAADYQRWSGVVNPYLQQLAKLGGKTYTAPQINLTAAPAPAPTTTPHPVTGVF